MASRDFVKAGIEPVFGWYCIAHPHKRFFGAERICPGSNEILPMFWIHSHLLVSANMCFDGVEATSGLMSVDYP